MQCLDGRVGVENVWMFENAGHKVCGMNWLLKAAVCYAPPRPQSSRTLALTCTLSYYPAIPFCIFVDSCILILSDSYSCIPILSASSLIISHLISFLLYLGSYLDFILSPHVLFYLSSLWISSSYIESHVAYLVSSTFANISSDHTDPECLLVQSLLRLEFTGRNYTTVRERVQVTTTIRSKLYFAHLIPEYCTASQMDPDPIGKTDNFLTWPL